MALAGERKFVKARLWKPPDAVKEKLGAQA